MALLECPHSNPSQPLDSANQPPEKAPSLNTPKCSWAVPADFSQAPRVAAHSAAARPLCREGRFVWSGSLQEVALKWVVHLPQTGTIGFDPQPCGHRDCSQEGSAGRGHHPYHQQAQSPPDMWRPQDRHEPHAALMTSKPLEQKAVIYFWCKFSALLRLFDKAQTTCIWQN